MVSLEHDLVLVSNLCRVRMFYIKIKLSQTFKAAIKQADSRHYLSQNDIIKVKIENYYHFSLIIRTIKSFGKISTSLSLRSLKLQLVVVGREGSRKLHKISNYSNYYTKNNSHYTSASAAIISGG